MHIVQDLTDLATQFWLKVRFSWWWEWSGQPFLTNGKRSASHKLIQTVGYVVDKSSGMIIQMKPLQQFIHIELRVFSSFHKMKLGMFWRILTLGTSWVKELKPHCPPTVLTDDLILFTSSSGTNSAISWFCDSRCRWCCEPSGLFFFIFCVLYWRLALVNVLSFTVKRFSFKGGSDSCWSTLVTLCSSANSTIAKTPWW